ncbi:hypothetical protein [Sulfurimonas sp.]|uniref:hypothetical protein n=1 Tax=Sulfurimonas sp. TaxID=2022749 RepID=UPI00286EAA76|nr:hypothetical protein [Sulfurimonas sp.]
MKILLLNNNPVVNKLVTLSAQKTSDELSIADSVEVIEPKSYDLLIVDDALYGEGVMQEINSKIKFNKSLYICSKEADFAEEFTKTLKKPFLPTDLVDMLISLGKMTETIELDKIDETHDKFESFDNLDELDEELDLDLDELDGLDELDELDELDDLDEKLDEDVEDVEFKNSEHDTAMDGVLDKDELQEVQNLLEETEMEEDLGFDDSDLELENFVEDEEVISEKAEEVEDLELEDFVEDEEVISQKAEEVEDLELEEDLEPQEAAEEFEDLESQIESAVQALSDEDLQTEVDQDLLFNIDSLSSRDLKLAIGEEVNEEEFDETLDEDSRKVEEFEEDLSIDEDSIDKDGDKGVEALKKLLKALSSEDVVASLKGMKISINITLGDK